MHLSPQLKRIHPLVAVAACAVTVFSLVGIAAMTGLLPSSHGSVNYGSRDAMQSNAQPVPAQGSDGEWDNGRPVGKATQLKTAGNANPNANPNGNPGAVVTPAQPAAPAHKTAQNSAVGIGVGAVVGGVLGSQVGRGDGKTLATILGAVGGGYVGNEIAKKNQ